MIQTNPMPIKINLAHNLANLKKNGYHFSLEIDTSNTGNKRMIGNATKI